MNSVTYDLRSLAVQFGTPSFIYDSSTISSRVDELRAFDTIRYAQKALGNISILSWIRRQGCVVDAVTAGEIYRALAAGFRGHCRDIVYTADVLDNDAIPLIRDHHLPVNIGSPDMIDALYEANLHVPITIRVNPGFGHGHSQKVNTGGESSKHGVWHGDLKNTIRHAVEKGFTVDGIHMHIGSGADFDHLSKVAHAIETSASLVPGTLRHISAGGGLPIPYRPHESRIDIREYSRVWLEAKERIQHTVGHPVHLEVEPGRYLVAESGILLCTIQSIKRMGSATYYIVDAGFDTLVRPAMYGAYHPISILPRDSELTLQSTTTHPVAVAGPLCESCDLFTQGEGGVVEFRDLPPASRGDFLILHHAGAYGSAMSSNYNARLKAAEVLIVDSIPHLIRRREMLSDLTRNELLLQDIW
jgi:diaminopimelate decarboxylase